MQIKTTVLINLLNYYFYWNINLIFVANLFNINSGTGPADFWTLPLTSHLLLGRGNDKTQKALDF